MIFIYYFSSKHYACGHEEFPNYIYLPIDSFQYKHNSWANDYMDIARNINDQGYNALIDYSHEILSCIKETDQVIIFHMSVENIDKCLKNYHQIFTKVKEQSILTNIYELKLMREEVIYHIIPSKYSKIVLNDEMPTISGMFKKHIFYDTIVHDHQKRMEEIKRIENLEKE